MVYNRLKRILSIILVCLMLSPVISFATADTDTATDNEDVNTDNTDDEDGDKQGGEDTPAGSDDVNTDGTVYGDSRTEAERRADAIADAIYATRDELLAKYTSYEFRCESDNYEMYYDARTLGVIIRDKKTGAIMKSVISEEDADARKYSALTKAAMTGAVGVKAIVDLPEVDRFTKVKESDFMSCVGEGNTTEILELMDNGFRAKLTFQFPQRDEKIGFELIVTLDNDGMHATVPNDSIERSDSAIHISEMYIYALMGYTERGDRDGYMILPDGNGIIVNFEDFIEYGVQTAKFKSGYTERVYGTDISYKQQKNYADSALFANKDTELVYAPFWGMVHTDTKFAVLGVVDEGDTNMQVEGNFNGTGGVIENYCGGRFIYRRAYAKPTNENANSGVDTVPEIDFVGDAKVTFIFATGENANYTGLAKAYRDKLTKEGVLTGKSDDKFNVRVDFLGSDKEEFLVFKKTVTATTVSNIRDIVSELKNRGVDNMVILYEGWQKGGVYGLPVSEYEVDSSIGSKSDLNKLSRQLKDLGIEFYLSQDTQSVNADNSMTNGNNVKRLSQFTYSEKNRFAEVYKEFKILKPSKTKSNVENLAKEFRDNGINNIAISGMPSNIFSYSQNTLLYSRESTAKYYSEALESIPDDMTVALKKPFKIFWKYMDTFLDMPLSSSMFGYISNEIPFISIVLDGKADVYSSYVNFEANKSESFLKLATYGIRPSYILTYENPSILQYTNSNWIYTSEYVHYVDQIAQYYEWLKTIDEVRGGSLVASYDIFGDVHRVIYENGNILYADYKNYYIAMYKDGKMTQDHYNAQTETGLTPTEKSAFEKEIAAIDNTVKTEEIIGDGIVTGYVTQSKYTEAIYSNGAVVVNDYVSGDVYVMKDGKTVFGYNTNTNEVFGAAKLESFAGQLNQ